MKMLYEQLRGVGVALRGLRLFRKTARTSQTPQAQQGDVSPWVRVVSPADEQPGEWAKRLYPDLVRLGGVLNALRSEMAASHPSLADCVEPTLPNTFAYACLLRRPRTVEIDLALEQRLFLLGFWARGVQLTTGSTPNWSEAVEAMAYWVESSCLVRELAEQFPFVAQWESAEVWERGEEVEARWQVYLNRGWRLSYMASTKPLIEAAAHRPELRQLFPFTSMGTLHFSRCTGYPYFTRDISYVSVLGDGRYRVHARDGTSDNPDGTVLGEGDAETAVALVVANMPEGIGPAVAGTADDFLEVPES